MKKKIFIVVIVFIIVALILLLLTGTRKESTFEEYTESENESEFINNVLDSKFDRSVIKDAAEEFKDVKVSVINEVTNIDNFHQFEVIYKDGSCVIITWDSGTILISEMVNDDLGLEQQK